MIRILCYGDSNTWGYVPGPGTRYPSEIRWTGVLRKLLGPGYEIIEEGLNGRTTNVDYKERYGKNGRSYLMPCLDSHHPLDYIFLNLGPNDMKVEFNRSAQQIAAGMEELIQIAKGKNLERPSPQARIVLVAPPPVLEVGDYVEALRGAIAKSAALSEQYRDLARRYDLTFIDLYSMIEPSPIDGVHLSPAAHAKMAEVFFNVISADNRESPAGAASFSL